MALAGSGPRPSSPEHLNLCRNCGAIVVVTGCRCASCRWRWLARSDREEQRKGGKKNRLAGGSTRAAFIGILCQRREKRRRGKTAWLLFRGVAYFGLLWSFFFIIIIPLSYTRERWIILVSVILGYLRILIYLFVWQLRLRVYLLNILFYLNFFFKLLPLDGFIKI